MGVTNNVWGIVSNKNNKALLSSCAIFALITAGSVAQADTYPRMEGEVAVELAGDSFKQGDAKQKSVVPEVEVGVGWLLTPSWSVQGGFMLESRYEGDKDFYFKDLGLSTDELYVQYEAGMFRAFAGKANPTFGTAWDIAPGVYGADLAEDYELGEGYIAAGGGVTLEGGFGKHILTGTAFRLDRSFFSQTAFINTGQVSIDDGGLSNTRGIKSFSVTLDSENIFGINGVNSHLGYRKQGTAEIDKNDATKDDETGLVVGLSGAYKLSPAIEMEVMGEYAKFSNFEGEKDIDAQYITLGAGFAYQSYNLALAYTMKEVDNVESTQLAASVGTEIWNEWALDVGYKLDKADGEEDAHTVGFRLGKAFEFSSGQ